MVVDFITTGTGLTVKFKNLSKGIPTDSTFNWNFGDGETSQIENPSHTYQEAGFFTVMLTVINSDGESEAKYRKYTIIVTDQACTKLPGSIYDLIDTYIPATIFGCLSGRQKQTLIEKWQAFIYPLVNHCIPPEEFNNELYYEALENQLVMQLAARDYMLQQFQLMLGAEASSIISNNSYTQEELDECGCADDSGSACTPGGDDPDDPGSGGSSSSSRSSGGVKSIKTGPSEVEFHNEAETDSNLTRNLLRAAEKDNILDRITSETCYIAESLEIFLPFCDPSRLQDTVIPRVIDRRRPGLLDGPNPKFPIVNKWR